MVTARRMRVEFIGFYDVRNERGAGKFTTRAASFIVMSSRATIGDDHGNETISGWIGHVW